jgi:hypothetical protein
MGKAMLIVALGFTVVVGMTLNGLNDRGLTSSNRVSAHYESIISRNLASSGANIAATKLYRNFLWRSPLDSTNFNSGSFKASFEDMTFDTALTASRVMVTSVSEYAGRRDTVRVMVGKPPFSYFAQFTENWPPPPPDTKARYYATGDTVYGPIHTNTQFGIAGAPVFYGKVSSVGVGYYIKPSSTPDPKFYGGTEFGAAPIALPTDLTELTTPAYDNGDIYSSHVWLRFNPDGSYDYGNDNDYDGGTKYLSDYNGIIMSEPGKDIHVKGTFCGQATIYSGRYLYIEDDIVYTQNPVITSTAQDMLGLIADHSVIIADNTANRSNIVIHGAVMAVDSAFYVQNLSSGDPRGTMTIVGSVIQKYRGTRASTSVDSDGNVTITKGYRLKMHYDTRFMQFGPPHFPIADKVYVHDWVE